MSRVERIDAKTFICTLLRNAAAMTSGRFAPAAMASPPWADGVPWQTAQFWRKSVSPRWHRRGRRGPRQRRPGPGPAPAGGFAWNVSSSAPTPERSSCAQQPGGGRYSGGGAAARAFALHLQQGADLSPACGRRGVPHRPAEIRLKRKGRRAVLPTRLAKLVGFFVAVANAHDDVLRRHDRRCPDPPRGGPLGRPRHARTRRTSPSRWRSPAAGGWTPSTSPTRPTARSTPTRATPCSSATRSTPRTTSRATTPATRRTWAGGTTWSARARRSTPSATSSWASTTWAAASARPGRPRSTRRRASRGAPTSRS